MSLKSILLMTAMLGGVGGGLPDFSSDFERKLARCWSDADLHKEWDLIKQKKSKLSRTQRNEFCWYYERHFPEVKLNNFRRKTTMTIADWIALYDSGEEVESVNMGGLGMGYELALQNLAVEILRGIAGIDLPGNNEDFRITLEKVRDKAAVSLDEQYGFSGAQVGAATNLAAVFWRNTPLLAMDKMRTKDISRVIKLQKVEGIMTIKGLTDE